MVKDLKTSSHKALSIPERFVPTWRTFCNERSTGGLSAPRKERRTMSPGLVDAYRA